VITERKDHLQILAERLSKFCKNVIVLKGGMSSRESKAAAAAIEAAGEDQERLLLATDRYLGEGFDDAQLDTLFLTLPISWRGMLLQYAGRLSRLHAGKNEVMIYDYVDAEEPMLARMAVKRAVGYRSLGYRESANEATAAEKAQQSLDLHRPGKKMDGMKFDEIDKRMPVFETAHDHRVISGIYIVVRVDGRNFTRLTRDLHRFDVMRLSTNVSEIT
jgi:superfamily II DNA or RNA helicase